MSPAAFNLLEAIVRTTIMIADNTLTKDRAETVRTDLTGKLTSLKVVMQHEKDESLLQPMAQVILALGKHVLGRPVKVSDGDVSRKDLLGIVNDLARRSECLSAEEGLQEPGCAMCGCSRDAHNDPNASHRFMESRRDVVEKAPELESPDKRPEPDSSGLPHMNIEAPMPNVLPAKEPDRYSEHELAPSAKAELYGLDSRWRLITDDAGDPVMALYFNGNKDSLSQEQVEEIEEAVLPIIQRWGR